MDKDVKWALRTILSDHVHYETTLNWAVNYTRRAILMNDGEDLKTQLTYILCNLNSWRHRDAYKVRKILRDACK